jgi:calcineurin-like phosphoesterase family protein
LRTFFTSDHHFGHANIIDYCGRPYASVAEMNADLTQRWNETVAADDVVWHLGDFAMGDPTDWRGHVAGLNGRLRLVLGNHDGAAEVMREAGFRDVYENVVIDVDGYNVWLNHFPTAGPDGLDYRGRRGYVRPAAPSAYDIALCGHVHRKWTLRNGILNVGVDRWSYRPIELDDILTEIRDHAKTASNNVGVGRAH